MKEKPKKPYVGGNSVDGIASAIIYLAEVILYINTKK